MPAIITTNSQPTHYTIMLAGGGSFNGPAWLGFTDPVAGDIQILDYGVAVWQDSTNREVYPWHAIGNIMEIF